MLRKLCNPHLAGPRGEMVDTGDLKSLDRMVVPVQIRPRAPTRLGAIAIMHTRRRIMALAGAGLGVMGASLGGPARAGGSAGFYYPDEAMPHERTFMQWPVSTAVYADRGFLRDVQKTIARIANTIAEFEPVVMLMAPDHTALARK